MNFEEALKLLKAGKKVRRKDWEEDHDKRCFIFGDELCCESEDGVIGYIGLSIKNILATDWEEYKKPLLTEREKEYLKTIIKAHPKKIDAIKIYRDVNSVVIYLIYRLYDRNHYVDKYYVNLDYFKNLEDGKQYTLKELGLDEA